ncbi:uncharacterized protein LOC131044736 isoform X4 [Cryptomeria japonica]|uniref:uncharacterized protein LOC131044736 isoform X4 n=1 Tax=Cryptomeria japonica TaxID=3369 RepID=UPI0027DA16E4|nr:uncharacterized protein LOC131044736 isoform X4 [Cryptomeria japonica]
MGCQREGDAGRTHGFYRAHDDSGIVRSLHANIIPLLVAVTAACFMLSIPLSVVSINLDIVHEVPEGHVGTYWRGGALLKTITSPGFHLKIPSLTRYEPIQVTIQTDKVTNIPCGTKGGVMIYFEKIEIDEKMKEAIQADCLCYAPGIEIISVRVTKPTIPESIARNYEQMEEERTKVLIVMEKQKVLEMEAETLKKIAVTEAKKNSEVSRIIMEQRLMEKESIKKQQEIDNEMYLAREKSLADSNYYKVMKEAEANKLKLTPEFLELKFIEAIAKNSKMFFGNKFQFSFPCVPVLAHRILWSWILLEDLINFLAFRPHRIWITFWQDITIGFHDSFLLLVVPLLPVA